MAGRRDSPPKSAYRTLKDEHLRLGKLFVDTEFPPNTRSLFYSGKLPADLATVTWKRPQDIVKIGRAKFVSGGASHYDLDQGYLGNCWFVAAIATLSSQNTKLFEKVVPVHQNFDHDYAGIFHFRFWWYGEWKEVIIDDYLPADPYGLVFCKNREDVNEFWPALVEKAYAKLRGCYENLVGGKIQDALVDCIGGISESLDLKDKSKLPPNLFDLMLKTSKMNSLLGAAIFGPRNATRIIELKLPNGLYQNHAYSITALAEIDIFGKNVQLIRLRNPWGRKEWNGAWSDSSQEIRSLNEAQKARLGINVLEDGEFWMLYSDWLDNFHELVFCHLQPDALTQEIAINMKRRQWNTAVFHDSWVRGLTAGGCGNSPHQALFWKNPQFVIVLSEIDKSLPSKMCVMIVSLMEKEMDNQDKFAIGFDVYKVINPNLKPLNNENLPSSALQLQQGAGVYEYKREVCRRFTLPPGSYVIIPSTFNPNEEAEFLLRVITQKKVDGGVLDGDTPMSPKPDLPEDDLISELYAKYARKNEKMDAREMKKFLIEIYFTEFKSKLKFSLESCRSLLIMMDKNNSGFITLDEVRAMWTEIKVLKNVFERYDKDYSGMVNTFELAELFTKLGYPLSRQVLKTIVRRYGGRDNSISFTDFVIITCKLAVMFRIFQDHKRDSTDKAEFTLQKLSSDFDAITIGYW